MVKYIYCSYCSAKNDSFNEYCTECGQKIDSTTVATHTVVQDPSNRVAVSGSYDAMYGTRQEKKSNSTKSIIFSLLALVIVGIMVFVFYYLWSTNVPDTILP